MSGVTWSERQPNDWLASNGRWYPASKYPRGWNFLALPPAPGHGFAHRVVGSEQVSATSPYTPPSRHTSDGETRQAPTPPPRPAPAQGDRGSSSAVAQTGRTVADATVTKVSNYKRRIEPRTPSSGALPPPPAPPAQPPAPASPPERPSPPGRVSKSPRPNAPVKSPAAAISDAFQSGDLGGVLDKARRKIEDAINEASEKR